MTALAARLLSALSRAARRAAESFYDNAGPGAQARAVVSANAGYDMATDPDEAYYADRYWARLAPALERLPAGRAARVLDLGCGHGRFSIPLARWASAGRIVGVDLSGASLEAARRRAQEQGVSNAEFVSADAAAYAASLASASLDAVVCLELLYNLPAYRETLGHLARALKPGGLLVVSLRPRWFELLRAVRAGDFESAAQARDRREGRFGGGAAWSCWHTPEEVRVLLKKVGFERVALSSIGPFSGLAEDPLGALARPSALSPAARRALGELEDSLAEEFRAQGRYILAVAWRIP